MSSAEITYLTAEIYSTTSINIYWNGNYINNITLEQSKNNKTYSTISTGLTCTQYTVSSLIPNNTYYFRATPYDSSGNSGTQFITQISLPNSAYITSFYAGNSTYNTIPIFWKGNYYSIKLKYKKSTDSSYGNSISISGKNFYQFTGLDENTSYDFVLTPILVSGKEGDDYILNANTSYLAVLTSIDFIDIKDKYVKVKWEGLADFIKFQISTDGVYFTNEVTYNCSTDISGYAIIYGLSPLTTYYFRAVPYNANYKEGTTFSTSLTTTTFAGITSFYASNITYYDLKLNWKGGYDTVEIYKSAEKYGSYEILNTITDSSYIDTSISPYTTYYYYILPYYDSVVGISSDILEVLTDYNTNVYFTIDTVTTNSFIVNILSTSLYQKSLIQISDDSGVTFYDISYLTQRPQYGEYSYYITSLQPNTYYTVRITPYSIYNTAGNVYQVSQYTLPSINSFDLSYIGTGSMKLLWSGSYNYVNLEYATDSNFSSTTVISSTLYDSSYNISLPTNTTYYFRITPINNEFIDGSSSTIYNPTIHTIYFEDVSINRATLYWNGVFSYAKLQYATTASAAATDADFVDFSMISYDTKSIYFTSPSQTTPIYYRIIPYYGNILGQTSSVVYNPIISNFTISSIKNNPYQIQFTWTGTYKRAKLQYLNISGNLIDISSQIIGNSITFYPGFDIKYNSYNYKITPYSLGYNSLVQFDISGASYTVANPSIMAIYITDISYVSDISSLQFTLQFSGASYTKNEIYSSINGKTYNLYSTTTNTNSTTITTTYLGTTYYYLQPKNTISAAAGLSSELVYIPYITDISISKINYSGAHYINLNWNGTYGNVILQYSIDNSTFYDLSNINTNYFVVNKSVISDFSLTQNVYYFRVIPYSPGYYNGAAIYKIKGLNSNTVYNALINSFYISDISTNYLYLNWSGVFDAVTIQKSSDNKNFVDLYTYINRNTQDISAITSYTTYYRIIPYYKTITGYTSCVTYTTYNPVIVNFYINYFSNDIITLKWTGLFDYVKIQYGTSITDFVDLSGGITTNTYTATNVLYNPKYVTYYFRAIPYVYSGNSINTGIESEITYNASISSFYAISPADASTNTIDLYILGIYDHITIYYGLSGEFLSNSENFEITSSELTSYDTIRIRDLSSNSKYYFSIIPYNADDVEGIVSDTISGNTISLLNGLQLAYNVSNSTYRSIQLSWQNNGYDRIEIYDASASILVYQDTSGGNTYYDSFYVENLVSNTKYVYYARVYDSINNVEQTDNINAYTYASFEDVSMSYVNVESNNSITFSWKNSGYSIITIYNYTLYGSSPGSKAKSYTRVSNIVSHNTKTDGGEDLSYNTMYVYKIIITGLDNTENIQYKTIYTLAHANLNINFNTNLFSSTSVPIDVSGSFSGFYLYITNDTTGSTSTYEYNNTVENDTISVILNSTNSIISVPNTQYSFKIKPYSVEGIYSSISTYTVKSKTLGQITDFYTYSITDSSSINLYWDGSFSAVILEQATDASFIKNYTLRRIVSSTKINNVALLNPDTIYYFRINPVNSPFFNGVDICGASLTNDVSGRTFGYVTQFTVANIKDISSTQITLTVDGSYTKLYLEKSINGTTYSSVGFYDASNSKTITISELTPYTTYYFRGTSINQDGVYSNINNKVIENTTGVITQFYVSSVIDNSAIILYFDGSYNYVSIEQSRYTNLFDRGNTIIKTTSIRAEKYTFKDLSANTSYYYRITPINRSIVFDTDNSGGIFAKDVSATTLGFLSKYYIDNNNVTYNSILVVWSGLYNYVYLEYSLYSSFSSETTTTVNVYDTQYDITNLVANRTYYVRLTPVNSIGVFGRTTEILYTTTDGSIPYISTYSNTTTSCTLLVTGGTYSFARFKISTESDVSSNYSYVDLSFDDINDKTYTFFDLSENTYYYFMISPYNSAGQSDTNSPITKYITLGNLYSFQIDTTKSITSTTIPLKWSGKYSSVYLEQSADNITYNYIGTISGDYTIITGLIPNTLYYFRATPVNQDGVFGTTITNVYTSTRSTITSLSISYIGDSSAQIIFDGCFNKIGLYTTNHTIDLSYNSGVITTGTDISGLNSFTTYSVYIKTYNRAGVLGDSSFVIFTTLPRLYYANIYAYDFSSILINYDGSLNGIYVSVKNNNTIVYSSNIFDNSKKTFIKNLNPNTAYTFSISPIDISGRQGYFYRDLSAVTYGYMKSARATVIDISAIQLVWDGSFDSVQIYVSSTAGVYSGTSGKTYTGYSTILGGLPSNQTYYYKIVAINVDGSGSTIIQDISAATYAYIKSAQATVIDNSAIMLSWDGSFNYVQIYISSISFSYIETIKNYTGYSVIMNGLLSNQTYYYRIAAINVDGYIPSLIKDISATTYSKFYYINASTIDTSSILLTWDGSYSSIKFEISTTKSDYTNSSVIVFGNSYVKNTIVNGLYSNKRYYFRTTIFNSIGIQTSISDISSITYPFLSKTFVTVVPQDLSSIVLTWDGSYTTIQIYQSTISNSYTEPAFYTTTYSSERKITITGLTPNKAYYYKFVPYNESWTGTSIMDVSTITYPQLKLYILSYGETFAVLAYDGSFTQLNITVNGITTTYYSLIGTTGTDISNLIPNNLYTAYGTAYNKNGLTTIKTININTNSTGTVYDCSGAAYDSSGIRLTWKISKTTSYVAIYWNKKGGTYNITDNSGIFGNTITSTIINRLSPNTLYYFKITAYSLLGNEGNSIQDISYVTYGYIKSAQAVRKDISSILLTWDGSFDNVQIYTSTIQGNYIASTVNTYSNYNATIINLYANRKYYFKIFAKNNSGLGSIYIQDISAITYAYIKSAQATVIDNSAINLTWDGSFDTVQIYTSTIKGTYTGIPTTYSGYNAIMNGLSSNTIYYYKIVAFNVDGSGAILVQDISNITYSSFNIVSVTAYDSSSVQIYFNGYLNNALIQTVNTTGTVVSSITYSDISNSYPLIYYKFETTDCSGIYLYNYVTKSYDTTQSSSLIATTNINTSYSKYGSGSFNNGGSISNTFKLPSININSNGLTFSGWFIFTGSTSKNIFFDIANGVLTDNIIGRISYNSSTNSITVEYIITISLTTSTATTVVTSSYVNSTWFHITIVHSETNVYIYYNGSLISTIGLMTYPTIITRTSNYIGRENNTNNAASSLNSYMDNFMLFNSALTSTEIQNIYNNSYISNSYLYSGFHNNTNIFVNNLTSSSTYTFNVYPIGTTGLQGTSYSTIIDLNSDISSILITLLMST